MPVLIPDSLDAAIELLAKCRGAPLGGGTWIMRGRARGGRAAAIDGDQPPGDPGAYVLVGHLPVLRRVERGAAGWTLGGAATHAQLAALPAACATGSIAQAAASSAFPAIRSVATLAGNLGARGFAEADLVPALLASDARLTVREGARTLIVPIDEYLRNPPVAAHIVVSAEIAAPPSRYSSYERLTVRGGGEYAIAAAAVSVDLDRNQIARAARVAFGSVEPRSRRCVEAEAELVGHSLDDATAERAGTTATKAAQTRDDEAVPADYRRRLAGVALRRAVQRLRDQVTNAA